MKAPPLEDPFDLPDPYPSGIQGPLGPYRMALIRARIEFVRRDRSRQVAQITEAAKDPVVAVRLNKPL